MQTQREKYISLPTLQGQHINGRLQEEVLSQEDKEPILLQQIGGAVPGLYPNAVSVTETNASNCPGLPINLDVYVLQMGLSTLGPFCAGDPSTPLGGSPIGGTYSGTGVVGNQFDPVTAGLGVHVITYSLAGCNTTINVTVNNGPVTGPIQHY